MNKGRHADGDSRRLRRESTTMIVGIIAVGVIVFGGLWLFNRIGNGNDGPEVAGTVATTTRTSTSVETTVSSTRPTTSTATTTPTTATTVPTTTTTAPLRSPAQVIVLVLNSGGRPGLAATVSANLDQLGYQTLTPTNYSPTLEVSRVWYQDGFAPEAFILAAQFPDAVVEPYAGEDTGADIVVVLGESYTG